MWWIILLLLLTGPLRRPFLAHGAFTIPACIAGFVAAVFASAAFGPNDPAWMTPALVLIVGAGGGVMVKQAIDEHFGGKRR